MSAELSRVSDEGSVAKGCDVQRTGVAEREREMDGEVQSRQKHLAGSWKTMSQKTVEILAGGRSEKGERVNNARARSRMEQQGMAAWHPSATRRLSLESGSHERLRDDPPARWHAGSGRNMAPPGIPGQHELQGERRRLGVWLGIK